MDDRPLPGFSSPQFFLLQFVLTIVYVGGIGGWLWQGGFRGNLIKLDQHPGIPYRLQVELNQCDWPDLMVLPGIGEVLAQRIIQYRRTHGSFDDVSQLGDVKGIGPKVLEQIRPHLECSPAKTLPP